MFIFLASAANKSTAAGLHVNLGDLPTWLLFVGAFAAALIALRQLRIQADDSARATRIAERKQAESVDLTWRRGSVILALSSPLGRVILTPSHAVVIASNNSDRPIRHVSCMIVSSTGTAVQPKYMGVIQGPLSSSHEFTLFDPQTQVVQPLLRPHFQYGFVFDYKIPDADEVATWRPARPVLTFTDDTEFRWRLDSDLRLRRADAHTSLMHRMRRNLTRHRTHYIQSLILLLIAAVVIAFAVIGSQP